MMRKSSYDMEEVIPILSERVRKYTSNESTSIPYDIARQLMNSILYCMEEVQAEDTMWQEETFGQEEASLRNEVVKTINEGISARKAFEIGLTRKKEKIKQAKFMYQEINKSFYSYKLRCYFDTIVKGMPVFFERYDVEYDATNHILTLDYPLLHEVKGLCGIDLIDEYLRRIQIEQAFLNRFSSDIVEEMLCGYHEEYPELIFNVSKLVLRNAIGCKLINKNVYRLIINEEDRNKLSEIVDSCSLEELETLFHNTLEKLIKEVYEDDEKLFNYLKNDMKEFAFEVKSYAEIKGLEHIFLGVREEIVHSEIMFEDGSSMKDTALRQLIDEMREIRYMTDKISLLKERIKSLSDLKEVLKECFYREEYEMVFQLLSDEEIGELKNEIKTKIQFDEELEEWENALLGFNI